MLFVVVVEIGFRIFRANNSSCCWNHKHKVIMTRGWTDWPGKVYGFKIKTCNQQISQLYKYHPGNPVVNNVWEEKIQYQQEESNGFLQLAVEAREGCWLETGTVTVMVTCNIYAVVRKCFLYNPQAAQKQTHIYNLDLLQRMAVGEKEMQWFLIK